MTKTACAAAPIPPPAPRPETLRQQLTREIRALPFGAVTVLLRQLLHRMGYAGVTVRRTQARGHNSGGGWDLEAVWEGDFARQRLLVQLKHFPAGRPVQLRYVDELRGALRRAGASHGLLVTTGTFAPPAREAAGEDLTLVDGDALVRLLLDYHVGVKGDKKTWQIDIALLDRLRRLFAGAGTLTRNTLPRNTRPGADGLPEGLSPVTLTVITTALLGPDTADPRGIRRDRDWRPVRKPGV